MTSALFDKSANVPFGNKDKLQGSAHLLLKILDRIESSSFNNLK